MIHFVIHHRAVHTLSEYLERWKPQGLPEIRTLTYHSLKRQHRPFPGAYIFDSFERLTPQQLDTAGRFWDALAKSPARPRLLNHPQRAMLRFELLTSLYNAGINQFRVFPISSPPDDLRFPVFFRFEHRHTGSLGMARDWKEFREGRSRTVAHARSMGLSDHPLMVVELCDTRDADGWYRKYGAYAVGEEVIAKHLLFGEDWMVKRGRPDRDLYHGSRSLMEEELAFLQDVPHADQIRRIFRAANIDYGRIDYAFKNGAMQVWEINMNATLFEHYDLHSSRPRANSENFSSRLTSALQRLEQGTDLDSRHSPIFVSWPRRSVRQRFRDLVGVSLRWIGRRFPPVRDAIQRWTVSQERRRQSP